jgi:uncharacterized membrane protein YqjE
MTEVLQPDKSLGKLVAQATSNLSSLVKSEIQLAKLELKVDAKRAALSAGLIAVAALPFAMFFIIGSFALAFGLGSIFGWSNWLSFLVVAGFYLVLTALLVLFGVLWLKRLKGAPRTRQTVKDDLAMLRRSTPAETPPAITE